jgi:plasmid stabilization system protein ParE
LVDAAVWYIERHPGGYERFARDLHTACERIARHPNIGRERSDLRSGLRSWLVHPYLLFYSVDDALRRVFIERVMHARMDIAESDFER